MQRTLFGMVLLTLACGSANAALLSRMSGAAYYDDVLNITWPADANAGAGTPYDDGFNATDGRMTWASAQLWVASLNTASYLGVNDWRLPITVQPDPTCAAQFDPGSPYPIQGFSTGCTGSEMGHLYNVDGIKSATPNPFVNVRNDFYWSDTTVSWSTARAWAVDFGTGSQNTVFKTSEYYAWAVRSGDIAPVPVPAAVWLFGSALGVMGWIRRTAST